MNGASLELQDVAFEYRHASPVLEGIDLELGPGLLLLVGPNGCGKSTLMKMMAGVEKPHRGRVRVGGFDAWRDERAARRLLAYVPEQPDVTPFASVLEVLELVADLRDQPRGRAEEVLDEQGLRGVGGRSIRELSKGQRRRVLLAAAHVGSPPVLLFDEPFDALDRGARTSLLVWIERRLGEGALVVAVTHELELLLPLATSAASVVRGRAVVLPELPSDGARRLAKIEPLARGE